jgi:hypothetical protein
VREMIDGDQAIASIIASFLTAECENREIPVRTAPVSPGDPRETADLNWEHLPPVGSWLRGAGAGRFLRSRGETSSETSLPAPPALVSG